jgi:hypothetical protein
VSAITLICQNAADQTEDDDWHESGESEQTKLERISG